MDRLNSVKPSRQESLFTLGAIVLAVLLVELGAIAISADGYMPHGMCYLWEPRMIALHLAADLTICMAYYAIPFVLWRFIRRQRGHAVNWIIGCFAGFILLCGTTHLIACVTIWHPWYWFDGAVKTATAIFSVATLALLWRITRRAKPLPDVEEIYRTNAELRRRIERLRATYPEDRGILEEDKAAEVLSGAHQLLDDYASLVSALRGHPKPAQVGKPAEDAP